MSTGASVQDIAQCPIHVGQLLFQQKQVLHHTVDNRKLKWAVDKQFSRQCSLDQLELSVVLLVAILTNKSRKEISSILVLCGVWYTVALRSSVIFWMGLWTRLSRHIFVICLRSDGSMHQSIQTRYPYPPLRQLRVCWLMAAWNCVPGDFSGKVGWLQATVPLVSWEGKWTATCWLTAVKRILDPLRIILMAMLGGWCRCTTSMVPKIHVRMRTTLLTGILTMMNVPPSLQPSPRKQQQIPR